MFKKSSVLVGSQQYRILRRGCAQYGFVPKHSPCQDWALAQMQEFINSTKKLFVLTGAGISTESGIPDYRSERVGLYATSTKRPVQIKVSFIIAHSYSIKDIRLHSLVSADFIYYFNILDVKNVH